MTLRTDSIYGHSEPFGYDGQLRLLPQQPTEIYWPIGTTVHLQETRIPIVGPFVTAGLGVADAIWGEQLYDWVDDNF